MSDYFGEALSDFVRNFSYGGAIEHLLQNGYTIDRMIAEDRVNLDHDQIADMIDKMNERRVRAGKEPYSYR